MSPDSELNAYAASPILPRAKVTHIEISRWFEDDYEEFFEEIDYEPKYVYFDDGSFNISYGHYVKDISFKCRKEKGKVKYQFAVKWSGQKKWIKIEADSKREGWIADIPRNKTLYLKVRTFKKIGKKRYYGKWSPIVKESTYDKEVHPNTIYTKNGYVKGYIKGAYKGEKIKVEVGKSKYKATVNKTSKKYPFKIYIGNHKPGSTIKIKLLSPTNDTLYTYTYYKPYYAKKIGEGYTKDQVRYTKYWGSPDSKGSSSGGWSYWYYEDGSYVYFKNGKVRDWYYVE